MTKAETLIQWDRYFSRMTGGEVARVMGQTRRWLVTGQTQRDGLNAYRMTGRSVTGVTMNRGWDSECSPFAQ